MRICCLLLFLFCSLFSAKGQELCEKWDFEKGENNKASVFLRVLGCVTPDSYLSEGEVSVYGRLDGHLYGTYLPLVDIDARTDSRKSMISVMALGQEVYSFWGRPVAWERQKKFTVLNINKEFRAPLPIGGLPFQVGVGVKGELEGEGVLKAQVVPSKKQFLAHLSPAAEAATYAFAGVGFPFFEVKAEADVVLAESLMKLGAEAGFTPEYDSNGEIQWMLQGRAFGEQVSRFLSGRLGVIFVIGTLNLPFSLAYYPGFFFKDIFFEKEWELLLPRRR